MFVEKASPYGSAVRSIIQGNTLIGNVHDCIDRLTIVCRNFTSELPNSGKFYLASKGSSFCSTFSPIYSFATDSFLESLFENLIVEISNCVLFIIITEFSEIYNVRQSLYKTNFLSVRNIERFKNNFIWQTTIRVSIQRPKNLYNSLYGLWVIRTTGIYYKVIYANRTNELSKLRKTPLATVTLIELLDFTSSRFDEIFYTLGNGLRFTLTSVVGQIIGLIWRGIIQGLKY